MKAQGSVSRFAHDLMNSDAEAAMKMFHHNSSAVNIKHVHAAFSPVPWKHGGAVAATGTVVYTALCELFETFPGASRAAD